MSEGAGSIVLGTRGSALALAQAEMTERALQQAHPGLAVERRIIKTTGDRRTDVPLVDVAKVEGHLDKGVFIKELEVALAAGEIDFAVHSLKDMPSELAEEFAIAAVLPRAPVGDVLVSVQPGGLEALPEGSTVATSSVRRQRQLQWMRPDLQVVDIRGNVPTRVRKLHEQDELQGILLAEAGLRRLGMFVDHEWRSEYPLHAAVLDPDVFLPAAGQGAVALEGRSGDDGLLEVLGAINHGETMDMVAVERAFLVLLGAGCETPVGVRTVIEDDHLRVRVRVFEDDQPEPLEAEAVGACGAPDALARQLVDKLSRTR